MLPGEPAVSGFPGRSPMRKPTDGALERGPPRVTLPSTRLGEHPAFPDPWLPAPRPARQTPFCSICAPGACRPPHQHPKSPPRTCNRPPRYLAARNPGTPISPPQTPGGPTFSIGLTAARHSTHLWLVRCREAGKSSHRERGPSVVRENAGGGVTCRGGVFCNRSCDYRCDALTHRVRNVLTRKRAIK